MNYKLDELKNRLDTLYEDVTVTSKEAMMITELADMAANDKREVINNLYFKENSPVRIINTQFLPSGEGDATGEMIELSLKYDEYIEKLRKKANEVYKRHSEAVLIFETLMDLESPSSDILYLRYFKRMRTQEIWDRIHTSKSSYFRDHSAALLLLQKALENKEEGNHKSVT